MPFQRLHPGESYPGNGIGLAEVKRIVRKHGGDIRAEGAPGTGAKFVFTLPAGSKPK
jgi:signal transduction histidine kinase